MSGPIAVKTVAKACLGIGLLLLAFVAYQLWGTALYEHSAQARLQSQLRAALRTSPTLPKAPAGGQVTDISNQTAPATADPAAGQPVGLLSIPSIGMAGTAVVEGTGESQLQEGPGHYPGTPLPGESGNAAIAGHRTTYGAPFYSLDALHPGDAIVVQTAQGIFQYQVVLTKLVDPSDTSVLQPTPLPELTLTTCNPRYSASQRLVVQALLHASVTNASFVAVKPPARRASIPTSLPGDAGSASQASTNVSGGVIGAVLFGLGVLLTALAARFAYRRLGGQWRWLSLLGVPLAVFLLLGCFQHVSLALPASF